MSQVLNTYSLTALHIESLIQMPWSLRTRDMPLQFTKLIKKGERVFCTFYIRIINSNIITQPILGLKGIPGGPSKSTARGLFDSNFRRVSRAISSYTSGLCRANRIVSSISLHNQQSTVSTCIKIIMDKSNPKYNKKNKNNQTKKDSN